MEKSRLESIDHSLCHWDEDSSLRVLLTLCWDEEEEKSSREQSCLFLFGLEEMISTPNCQQYKNWNRRTLFKTFVNTEIPGTRNYCSSIFDVQWFLKRDFCYIYMIQLQITFICRYCQYLSYDFGDNF